MEGAGPGAGLELELQLVQSQCLQRNPPPSGGQGLAGRDSGLAPAGRIQGQEGMSGEKWSLGPSHQSFCCTYTCGGQRQKKCVICAKNVNETTISDSKQLATTLIPISSEMTEQSGLLT
ncbi:uncharacterized protein ACOB8E_013877 [Sarcophilus harrisii]